MRPLKLSLRCDATDHYVYKGVLYIALSNGGVVCVTLNKIFSVLAEKYNYIEGIKGVLNISFRRNLYWKQYPVECMLSIPEVRAGLIQAWNRIISDYEFNLDLSELEPRTILKDIPGELLDMVIYGNKLYLACLNGLYEYPIEHQFQTRKAKLFDAKIFNINSGYSSVVLSLGNDGISHFNPFVEEYVNDKKHIDLKSLFTNWTPAGGLMNYQETSNSIFISNRIESNKSGAIDRYSIKEFAIQSQNLDELLKRDSLKILEKGCSVFSGIRSQYAYTKSGELYKGGLRVRDGRMSSIELELEQTSKHNLKKFGQLISGREVADYPIMEFEDAVYLLTRNDLYLLTDEPAVSIHTYPRSTHFRDLVTITTDEYIELHSIDIISDAHPNLHPNPRKRVTSDFDNDNPLVSDDSFASVSNPAKFDLNQSDLPF